MVFFIFFIANLVLCFVVANVAKQKNRSAVGFFLLSFFFSFLVGILVIAALPIKAHTARIERGISVGKLSGETCSNCGAPILADALICKTCKAHTGTPKAVEDIKNTVEGSFQQALADSMKKKKR